MKQKIFYIAGVLLLTVLLASSCGLFGVNEPTTEEPTTEEVTAAPTTELTTAAPTTEPTTAVPVYETEPAAYPPKQTGTVTRVTSKGFTAVTTDGITTINGVLIVNKSYSLPYDYCPGDLTAECRAAFNEMKLSAAEDGCDIYVSSGFRSYSTQAAIYERYCGRDGSAAADRYSARPGYSEHQSGLAIDLNSISSSFANTPEGQWVAENCYKYGFILRYPKDKESVTGYMYEPWHIRYVGVDAATSIYSSGLCLEEYYGIESSY